MFSWTFHLTDVKVLLDISSGVFTVLNIGHCFLLSAAYKIETYSAIFKIRISKYPWKQIVVLMKWS